MDKWINKKGWLRGYVKPREDEKPKNDEPIEENQQPKHGVVYHPIRCPKCRSKNHKCYASKVPVRYHICRDCGFNFKSTEIDA